ncbi:hypothetical protein B0H13DRAFT_2537163 [Mycena leptocephala]|nr:hypothetical protein B0H13DRAFT_2537163 [Mycena leptocephala]
MREDAMGEPTVESIQERCRERKKRRTPALPCVFRLPGRRRGELGLDVAGCVTHAHCPLLAPVALSAVATVEEGRGQAGGSRAGLGLRPGMRIDDGGVCDGERSSAQLGTPMVVYGMLGMGRGAWQAEASSGGGIVRKLLVAGEKLKAGSCGMGTTRTVVGVRRAGRDSRAAGREQRGDDMQASLAQRRMLVVARDVVGEVGGRRGRGGWWSKREAARGSCTGAAIQTIVADAERQYAEKREEDDQRERRTGYRTGAGVHEEGECEGERAERKAACVEEPQNLKAAATSAIRVDEKYAPEVKWDRTPISKHGMTNWKPPVCQSSAAAGSSTLDTTGLWCKPEMNGWYTSPSCPHGRGTEPGRAQRSQGPRREYMGGVHVELNLIVVRSISEIKTAFNDTATDPVEKGVNWHLLVSQCEMKACCHAEAPLSIQVWHPLRTGLRQFIQEPGMEVSLSAG